LAHGTPTHASGHGLDPQLPVKADRARAKLPADNPSVHRLGLVVNVVIRVLMVLFGLEVLLNLEDPRFVDKGLGVRTVAIIVVASLLIPAWVLWRRRGIPYPGWYDSLYLSTFLLDQAGNSFDLYETYYYFDLIPHSLNPGAYIVVLAWLARISITCAFGLVTVGHVLFEIQEAYGDVIFGTRNVGGVMDTVNDLLAGLIGAAVYGLLYWWFVRRPGREPPPTNERR
jgi:hypothetical protein